MLSDDKLEELAEDVCKFAMSRLGHPTYARLDDDPQDVPDSVAEHVGAEVARTFMKAYYFAEFVRMRKMQAD